MTKKEKLEKKKFKKLIKECKKECRKNNYNYFAELDKMSFGELAEELLKDPNGIFTGKCDELTKKYGIGDQPAK